MIGQDRPQSFKMVRVTDVSGVSGAGHVADGVIFSDGTTVLRWRTDTRSTAIYASFEDMKAIHGHGDATKFIFDFEYHIDRQCIDLKSPEFRKAVTDIIRWEIRKTAANGWR